MRLNIVVLACLPSIALAAFDGMGLPRMTPMCCHACRNILVNAPLECSAPMDHSHGHGGGHVMPETSSECHAGDEAYLTSLAYCMDTKCGPDVSLWEKEQFWADPATTGDPTVPAKWAFHEALKQVNGTPIVTWAMGDTLNITMAVNDTFWNIQYKFWPTLEDNNIAMYRYSLILVVLGFGVPIALTWLSKLPFLYGLVEKLNPYLIWPSTVGSYHIRPLPYHLGNAPNLGQAWSIAGFVILNIIFSCVGYQTSQPHPWGYDKRGEILAYAGYRTGEFAFALLPLLILFAGRNNILLWLTDWSHATFILLHRWVARLFALHTILHSIFLWAARVQTGTYAADVKMPYWQWGIAGTVFVSIMVIFSLLWMRNLSYEIFLVGHIILAILTVVTCWYHLILRFPYPESHEYWLYAAIAVWVFDRVIRVLRVVKNGVNKATITEVGPNHVRVDIPGIQANGKPGYHGYVYFPSLTALKPWENHPFSVNSMAQLASYARRHELNSPANSLHHSSDNAEIEKTGTTVKETNHRSVAGPVGSGVTLYIRKSSGMTRYLKTHASIATLLDGPYRNNSAEVVLVTDRILLIGGGIGITGLLAFLHTHHNVKLAWSINPSAEAVMRDLEPVITSVSDRDIRVGERLDIRALLELEAAAGHKRVGVVVCGPGSLCDEVRAVVSSIGRHGKTRFELDVAAFSW